MSQTFSFPYSIPYRSTTLNLALFPAVPVGLFGPAGVDDVVAQFDTGSSYCLFSGTRAATLGLSLLEGRPIRIATLAGGFTAYLHEIVLEIEGQRFRVEAAFSSGPLRREVLGGHSLFEQNHVGDPRIAPGALLQSATLNQFCMGQKRIGRTNRRRRSSSPALCWSSRWPQVA